MEFNPDKCGVLHISNKWKNITAEYTIHGKQVIKSKTIKISDLLPQPQLNIMPKSHKTGLQDLQQANKLNVLPLYGTPTHKLTSTKLERATHSCQIRVWELLTQKQRHRNAQHMIG
ncbi:hypothetical protein MAR_025144 [Mya arenaria]|uniref:Uncharacterized protein n=1 Tax=Mya arenaria TaxID=6604 RepID=A0ABY7DST6_MYAAR|nr:hypothetical protein MAR_025144 [Mya arenaria]